MMYKVAIIGYRARGQILSRAFMQSPDCKIIAVCDILSSTSSATCATRSTKWVPLPTTRPTPRRNR